MYTKYILGNISRVLLSNNLQQASRPPWFYAEGETQRFQLNNDALFWSNRYSLAVRERLFCPKDSMLQIEVLAMEKPAEISYVIYISHFSSPRNMFQLSKYSYITRHVSMNIADVLSTGKFHSQSRTTCFLSCFTSLLVDPVVEKQLIAATKEGTDGGLRWLAVKHVQALFHRSWSVDSKGFAYPAGLCSPNIFWPNLQ